jgi:hypothetical protein
MHWSKFVRAVRICLQHTTSNQDLTNIYNLLLEFYNDYEVYAFLFLFIYFFLRNNIINYILNFYCLLDFIIKENMNDFLQCFYRSTMYCMFLILL